jgi:hypothetical protein
MGCFEYHAGPLNAVYASLLEFAAVLNDDLADIQP